VEEIVYVFVCSLSFLDPLFAICTVAQNVHHMW